MMSKTPSCLFACCVLFAVTRSTPTNRFDRELSHDTGCGSNEDGYKDPVMVLGPRFTRHSMTKMCDSSLKLSPISVISKVEFTRTGTGVCADVCAQYRHNMLKSHCGPVRVTPLDSYCELNGATDGEPVDPEALNTSCRCVYKAWTASKVDVLQYGFHVNAVGNVRVQPIVYNDNPCAHVAGVDDGNDEDAVAAV